MKPLSFSIPVIVGSIIISFWAVYEGYYGWKTGNCGNENTLVISRLITDFEIACEGVARAEQFFTDYGLSVDFPITIFFEYKIAVDSELYDPEQVLGYFDPVSNYIQVPSYRYHPLKSDTIQLFRVELNNNDDNKELITSIVSHEVAHLLAFGNFEKQKSLQFDLGQRDKMGNGVQEYIAGVVQIGSMKKSMRDEVLSQFDKTLTFTYEQEINQLSYSTKPQEFWIKSYRHFFSKDINDKELILERIFTRELNPDLVFDNVMFALTN